MIRLAGCLTLATAAACVGDIGGGAHRDGPKPPAVDVGEMAMRRLSLRELDNSLLDLLGDGSRPAAALLPEDIKNPFDNDYREQLTSLVLVESIETLAVEAAGRLVADDERRDAVVGCAPASADDVVCMEDFVRRFGRLALRRPLSDAEVDEYLALGADFATQAGDFSAAVEVIVMALLQDHDFVYRIETGTPVKGHPGLFKLDAFQLATRMAYLIWGTTPNDALLDQAASGDLNDGDGVAGAARAMLADPRARDQIDRYHAMWLGYEQLPHPPALTTAMREETRALLDRVIFDERTSWLSLFESRDSFIGDELALHYGLAPPGSATPLWTDVSSQGRQGILGHGSFLSVANNPTDTSPTKRGKLIRTQLMCQAIPPPPPNVKADAPPDPTAAQCKVDQYAVHSQGTCAGCHDMMDKVGFGLERFDIAGRYRTHDEGKPQCNIDGQGELAELGSFNGPAELSDLLIETGVLDACAVEQLYRYAMGRPPGPADSELIDVLATAFSEDGQRFDNLLMTLVSHDAFRFRREETPR